MVSSIQKNASALNALGTDMSVTANNIANSNTRGFSPSDAVMVESKTSGVQVSISQGQSAAPQDPAAPQRPGELEQPGDLYNRQARTDRQGGPVREETPRQSNVDLAREITKTIPTKHAYSANIKAIQAQEEMMGAMLDVKA